MARVRDLWHTDRPTEASKPCRRHKGEFESARGCGVGKRWLALYKDPISRLERSGGAFDRKPDALARANDLETDIRRGDYIDPRAGEKPFDELATAWLGLQDVGLNGAGAYLAAVRQLSQAFGKTPIGQVQPSAALAWRKKRSKQVAADTINKEIEVAKSIGEMAVDDDLVRKSPFRTLKRARVTPRRLEPWPLEAITAIIDDHDDAHKAIPILGFGAALRQGEAFGVGIEVKPDGTEVDDIDWLGRKVHVRRQVQRINGRFWFAPPKYNSYGTVPVDEAMLTLLSVVVRNSPPVAVTLPWLDDTADDPTHEPRLVTVKLLAVSPRKNKAGGRNPLRDAFYNERSWYRALAAAGIERDTKGHGTGSHHLRHDRISYAIYEGKNLLEVQEIARHANLQMITTRYAHVIKDHEKRGNLDQATASVFRSCSVSDPEQGSTCGNAEERV